MVMVGFGRKDVIQTVLGELNFIKQILTILVASNFIGDPIADYCNDLERRFR